MYALIQNEVVFKLGGLPVEGQLPGISNISFQYGPELSPVPEPTTILLLGAGLVGLAGFGRKKFKK